MLPISWEGDGKLAYIDALFTAVSAVSITGLTTVKMEGFSTFGFILIMLLIQLGGLGFISITTFICLYLKENEFNRCKNNKAVFPFKYRI